jgi:hypothetical protein
MAEDKKVTPVFRPEEKGLRKVFGELEAEIMAYLWARGEGTVSEVFKALTTQREAAYNTVRTVMERLVEKDGRLTMRVVTLPSCALNMGRLNHGCSPAGSSPRQSI